MTAFGRSCVVCGARTTGSSRCARHPLGGARARSCVVCGTPTLGNFCALHDERLIYQSAEWQRVRRFARRRDDDTCTVVGCGRGKPTGEPVEVDHIRAIVDGGAPYDPSNVATLCIEHHRAKTRADRAARSGRST